MISVSSLAIICSLALTVTAQDGCLGDVDNTIPPVCDDWRDWISEWVTKPFFFHHTVNCSRYWVCHPSLDACLMECPAGLFFDTDLEVCNWPQEDCNTDHTCNKCEAWQQCVEDPNSADGWTCTPDCLVDQQCNENEYCDKEEDGGDGTCKLGCRNDNGCGECGTCEDHTCNQPECCVDEDCVDGVCINGECMGCESDSDCTSSACSSCIDHVCHDPECCTDEDCQDGVCTEDNICVECLDDSSCNGGICTDDNNCVECIVDDDCAGCSTCIEGNKCSVPECCIDDDCDEGICTDDNVCVECLDDFDCKEGVCSDDYVCVECMVDSDCSGCSACMEDNKCSSPECCTDDDCSGGVCTDDNVCVECLDSSDCDDGICTSDNVCVECGVDNDCAGCSVCLEGNTCSQPECCNNEDCNGGVCDQENNVCTGCQVHSDCARFNETCTDDYSEGGATCFFCDKQDQDLFGNCEPGCAEDTNCPGEKPVCSGQNTCVRKPGSSHLQSVSFITESCSNCSSGTDEGGPQLILETLQVSGLFTCKTNGLDHATAVDFAPNQKVTFESDEENQMFGGCHKFVMSNVMNGSLSWTGPGSWKIKENKVVFNFSEESENPSYACCVDRNIVSGESVAFSKCGFAINAICN